MEKRLTSFQNFKDEYLEKQDDITRTYYKNALQEFEIAFVMKKLRKEMNLSQREFAMTIDKPQSTVARIENGTMNPTIGLLEEIGNSTNKRLKIEFVDI